MDNFFIKPGYRINPEPVMYCDTVEDSQIYQVDVYRIAGDLARATSVRSVLDIGCGMATKLVEMVAPQCQTVVGMDTPSTIEQCAVLYPDFEWISVDLESPDIRQPRRYDLIISADVIEHLVNPDRLLDLIRRLSHSESTIVLSTPERDLRRGPANMGPPGNPAHVREWNSAEFLAYLQSRGMDLEENRIVDLREGMRTCQVVVGRFKHVDP